MLGLCGGVVPFFRIFTDLSTSLQKGSLAAVMRFDRIEAPPVAPRTNGGGVGEANTSPETIVGTHEGKVSDESSKISE